MKCSRVRELSIREADGVSSVVSEELAGHLRECGACRSYLAAYRRALAVVREPAGELSSGFEVRLRARLGREAVHPSWGARVRGWVRLHGAPALAGCACLLLIGLGLGYLSG